MWDSGKITKDATCKEPGSKTYTCTRCRKTSTEEIPVTGHLHTELRNVKAATCAEEGYTGDIYCKDCNTKLSSGEKIAKKAHTWDKGKKRQRQPVHKKESRPIRVQFVMKSKQRKFLCRSLYNKHRL